MTRDDYEYRGLVAHAWDLLRGDTAAWPDRAFYLECIRRFGEPVLDVGCGTGRLLLDYLTLGIDIDGVDDSPEMLALCREKARTQGLQPRMHEQPLEALSLDRRYRLILVPSSTLQLVTDPAMAARAARRMHDHLRVGGAVVASMMTLWRPGMPLYNAIEEAAMRADGAQVHRLARAWFEPATGCERTEDVYRIIVDGEVVHEEVHRRAPATRSYTQAEARALFEAAGFQQVDLVSRFSFEPARDDDTLFCVVATAGS
jgi:ubiquinone/menaquinone biosynthesis C-methylase UbiE